IVSGNGLYLAESKKVKILTGNTMTAASCLHHLDRYIESRMRPAPDPLVIAIAGANGNIGSGLAGCLNWDAYQDCPVILAGNHQKKLELLRNKLFARDRKVLCTTDLFDLKNADIIISCTNTNDPLLFPHHLDAGKPYFIIDIAVPGSVSGEVKRMKNVQFCKEASTVFMPDDPDFVISTHTPVGKIFCCAAEALVAALYDVRLPLKGHLKPEAIKLMMELGQLESLFNQPEYAPVV
ncbi:MAG TPA: hypothetical protein VJ508_11640, partial [Saprospiraceae bacterium]|nr:hypothetical protein [Saprospiraceae bacterium]